MIRIIETFPSKQMFPYLSLVERKVADFYHNMGYGLWVMGTNSAYAREGSVVIVHWPLPVRFGTSVTPSGKVVPMKKHRHSCKYSAAVDLKVWFARGAIELPGKEST